MELSEMLGIIGVIVGIVGLLYAVYQNNERRKLAKFVRSQAWYLYSKANNANGITQAAFNEYKEAHADSLNLKVVELLAKADAFGQDLFKETIRQIQLSETKFSRQQILEWVKEGKLDKQYVPLFEQICVSNDKTPDKAIRPAE